MHLIWMRLAKKIAQACLPLDVYFMVTFMLCTSELTEDHVYDLVRDDKEVFWEGEMTYSF